MRPVRHDRFRRLIEGATQMFVSRGYRLTQVADAAVAAGLAKGTVYACVESKEALFDAVLRYADRPQSEPALESLPLPTPKPEATVDYVRERLAAEAEGLLLVQVVSGARAFADPVDEIDAVLRDMYQRMARNRVALKLLDRCAPEYPELGKVWFGEGRWAQHQLLVLLLKRHAGQPPFRKIAHPELVARTLIETIAFWAMHRHFDPSPQSVDDEDAQAALVDLLVHGLVE